MTTLDMFLEVAADLYADNPAYRLELEAERHDPTPDPVRAISTWERLTELEWLIRNGRPADLAIGDVGYVSMDAAQTAAIRWRHPVHTYLLPDDDPAPSGYWARKHGGVRAA